LEANTGQGNFKKDLWIALALAEGYFVLYLRGLCPTVYLGDSGDFCTAIATGGVPHPPGYPLFSLLGRAALALVPVGEPAFRIGCVVAVAAAAVVAVLFLLAREIGASRWASATGAALFGVSYTFWCQSERVEVYSLHVLLASLLLLSMLRYRRTGHQSDLMGGVLAGSLGLAHHLTIVLLVPGLLLLCGRRLWQDPGPGRRLLVIAGLLPVGPAFYLLLLLWARAEPLHAWGHTVNMSLLWVHASAKIYQRGLQIPTGPYLTGGLTQAVNLFADNFPYLTFTLPLLGGWVLWKQDRQLTGGLLLMVAVVVAYNLCYLISDITAYYLVAWVIGAALLAVALDALRGWARDRWRSPEYERSGWITAVVSTLLVGVVLLRNWGACDLHRATWMRELARQKLEAADPGCVLITQDDEDRFPIWYVHDVLKVRPDVTPIDRGFVCYSYYLYGRDPSLWYLHRLRRQGVNAPLEVPRDRARRAFLWKDHYLIGLLERELRGRPLCMTFVPVETVRGRKVLPPVRRWLDARYRALPLGIILRMQPKDQPVKLAELVRQNEQCWNRITLPALGRVRLDGEVDAGYLYEHYACMLVNFGGLYEMAGMRDRAEATYRRAAEWAPGYQPAAAALNAMQRSARIGRKAASATG
jgi:hypothetical protein